MAAANDNSDQKVDAQKWKLAGEILYELGLWNEDFDDDAKYETFEDSIVRIWETNKDSNLFENIKTACLRYPLNDKGALKNWIDVNYLPILQRVQGVNKLTQIGHFNIDTKAHGITHTQIAAFTRLVEIISEQRAEIRQRRGRAYIESEGYKGERNVQGCTEGLKTFTIMLFCDGFNFQVLKDKFFIMKHNRKVLTNYMIGSRIWTEKLLIEFMKGVIAEDDTLNTNFNRNRLEQDDIDTFDQLFGKVICQPEEGKFAEDWLIEEFRTILRLMTQAAEDAARQMQQMNNNKELRAAQRETALQRMAENKPNALGDVTLLLNIFYPLVYTNFLVQFLEEFGKPVDEKSLRHFSSDLDALFCTIYRSKSPKFKTIDAEYIKHNMEHWYEDSDGDDQEVTDLMFEGLYKVLFKGDHNSLYMCPLVMRKNVMMRCFSYCRPLKTMESVLFRQTEELGLIGILGKFCEVEMEKDDAKFNSEVYAVYQSVVTGFKAEDFFSVKNLVEDRDVWSRISMDGEELNYGDLPLLWNVMGPINEDDGEEAGDELGREEEPKVEDPAVNPEVVIREATDEEVTAAVEETAVPVVEINTD